MAQRRLQLRLTQAQVAKQVPFQRKRGTERSARPLSRNSLAMYETDKSEPNLRLIEGIATALRVSPAWLAFGIGSGDMAEGKSSERAIESSISAMRSVAIKIHW
jgi:transcriptional regulator with XRE-family HTH domain